MHDLSKRRRAALRITGNHPPLGAMWLEPEPFGDGFMWAPVCIEHDEFGGVHTTVEAAAARLVEHIDGHAAEVTDLTVKML